MENVDTPECNLRLTPPEGMENCHAINGWTDGTRICTFWKLDQEEVTNLMLGGLLVLHIWGNKQPPVALIVEKTAEQHKAADTRATMMDKLVIAFKHYCEFRMDVAGQPEPIKKMKTQQAWAELVRVFEEADKIK